MPLALRLNNVTAGVYALAGTPSTLLTFPLALNPQVAQVPPVHPGQRYLRTGSGGHYTHNGTEVSFAFLTSHILTLVKLEAQRAVFRADGLGEIIRQGDTRTGFPELAPLADDPALEQLRRQYVGQPIWAYGGLSGTCHPDAESGVGFEAPFRTAVHIRDLVRVAQPTLLNANGGESDEVTRGADVIALTPLVVLIAASPDIELGGSFSASSSGDTPFSPDDFFKQLHTATDGCGDTYTRMLPDTWALERVFSRTPPGKSVPDDMPQDFHTLTRLQYAWLNGLPSVTYGTLKELLAQPTWAYRNIPFAATVTFGKNGLVQNIDVPSLP